MNPKPAIAFDLDDTLHDLTGAFLDFHLKTYGYTIPLESAPFFVGTALGISDEEEDRRWDKFFKDPSSLDIPAFEDARTTIEELKKSHRVVLMTDRSRNWIPHAKAWIEGHLKGVFDDLVFVKELSEAKDKAVICKEMNIAVLIDDKPSTIEQCDAYGVKGIFFDRPWNRGLTFAPRVYRLSELGELL
ncbi:MAG: hypothetical protein KGH68_03755 [Patescibacteria group bacterium]|nr:hypothetical protein [Patescibacteria group bacterium]